MQSSKRILFLADVNSAHTRKWADSLSEKGFEIGLFSLSKPETDWHKKNKIKIFDAGIKKKKFSSSTLSKISYLKVVPKTKQAIKEFKPNILHAHYATSYGMIGVRTNFHPYIISCWGSDVMDFPKKSFVHKLALKKVLAKADKIFATSPTIVEHIKKIIHREVFVTPFGIDTQVFKPMEVKSLFSENDVVIGTIKSLEKIYCIDILIEAFAKAKEKIKDIKLLIVGEGTEQKSLQAHVKKLQIEKDVLFTGKIDYSEIPRYHNMIDIFVNISERESFGVSVLESMACEKAVIVSDAEGLKDIVKNKIDGLIVEKKNIFLTAEAMKELMMNKNERVEIGINARKKVLEHYDWNKNISDIINIYFSVK